MNAPRLVPQVEQHVARIALLLTLLLAFALRMAFLDASSLWSDEGNTWALIQRPYAQIAADAAVDIHPPGYYWLLKAWTDFVGTTSAGMRSLSVWIGVLLVALVYRFGVSASTNIRSPSFVSALTPASPSVTSPSERIASIDDSRTNRWFGLLAAFIAAVNPFQIYYSQEARMYMLQAFAGAMLFYGVLQLTKAEALLPSNTWRILPATSLIVVAGVVGLWTHYSFPILLAGAGFAYLLQLFPSFRNLSDGPEHMAVRPGGRLLRFGLLYVVIGLCYLPWASIAIRQVLAWPKGNVDVPWVEGARLTLQTLLFGPLRNVDILEGWRGVAIGLLPFLGIVGLWLGYRFSYAERGQNRFSAFWLLLFWWAAPIVMMFGLGLFTDSFLKFLLAASPAWCLLIAAVPWLIDAMLKEAVVERIPILAGRFRRAGNASGRAVMVIVAATCVAIWVASSTAVALPGYYADESARDNYAGIAEYINYSASYRTDATSTNADEIVILNAPGQQDVWGYYDPGLPILSLPIGRPVDHEATIRQLDAMGPLSRLYGVFWATDESDPEQVVEGWLNQHAFKGVDRWQGNVRLVTYAFANQLACEPFPSPITFGATAGAEEIWLSRLCRARAPTYVNGDVVLIGLEWLALEPIETRLKVTLQLLDGRNQVIAQRDSEPAGGSAPTTDWLPVAAAASALPSVAAGEAAEAQAIRDNHGLHIPPGTPPGRYSLIVALYDMETGQRYLTNDGVDHLLLDEIEVARPLSPPPLALLPIPFPYRVDFDGITLLGYDLYAKGFAHEKDRPVQPGEYAHFTLYWQATPDWSSKLPDDLNMTLSLGGESLTAPLAGGMYPTGQWLSGDVSRGQFDLRFDGSDRRIVLTIGDDDILLGNMR